MAKRFTATEKWGKTWFMKLTPTLKCLWNYICDNADNAGVWDTNFELAGCMIGAKVKESDLAAFEDRIVKLPNGKHWLTRFIEFQYGKLSNDCRPHGKIFESLERNGISCADGIAFLKGYPRNPDTLSANSGYPTIGRVLEEDKEEEEGKDKGVQREKEPEPADAIYDAYPRKVGKQEAIKQIRLALKTATAERLLERTQAYALAVASWPVADHQFIPHPRTWFRQGRWDDDPAAWGRKGSANTQPKKPYAGF